MSKPFTVISKKQYSFRKDIIQNMYDINFDFSLNTYKLLLYVNYKYTNSINTSLCLGTFSELKKIVFKNKIDSKCFNKCISDLKITKHEDNKYYFEEVQQIKHGPLAVYTKIPFDILNNIFLSDDYISIKLTFLILYLYTSNTTRNKLNYNSSLQDLFIKLSLSTNKANKSYLKQRLKISLNLLLQNNIISYYDLDKNDIKIGFNKYFEKINKDKEAEFVAKSEIKKEAIQTIKQELKEELKEEVKDKSTKYQEIMAFDIEDFEDISLDYEHTDLEENEVVDFKTLCLNSMH